MPLPGFQSLWEDIVPEDWREHYPTHADALSALKHNPENTVAASVLFWALYTVDDSRLRSEPGLLDELDDFRNSLYRECGESDAYARSHLSGQDWPKYEKSPPEANWKGIPRGVASRTLNLNRVPLDFFSNLWEIGHYIVHFKSDMLPFVQTKYGRTAVGIDELNAENAEKACALVPALIEALKTLDPSKAVP